MYVCVSVGLTEGEGWPVATLVIMVVIVVEVVVAVVLVAFASKLKLSFLCVCLAMSKYLQDNLHTKHRDEPVCVGGGGLCFAVWVGVCFCSLSSNKKTHTRSGPFFLTLRLSFRCG